MAEGRKCLGSRLPVLDRALLTPMQFVKSFGMILDPLLSTEAQDIHTARMAFAIFASPATGTFLATLRPSYRNPCRLDYRNLLYAGLPLRLIQKLQQA